MRADTHLVYEWREGTVPPPYYYELSVTLRLAGDSAGAVPAGDPGGASPTAAATPGAIPGGGPTGEIRLLPDYEQHGPPALREEFAAAADALDALSAALAAAERDHRTGARDEHPPEPGTGAVGGETERLEWRRGGGAFILTSEDARSTAALTALAAAVRALVPIETWRRLHERRAAFWRERGEEVSVLGDPD